MKSTAERILDAAEDLFAERGYQAASLGEVAEEVGIRSPSLYNHYRNKMALYQAVLDRLVSKFDAPFQALLAGPLERPRILEWLHSVIKLHHSNPNLARLVQHEALSGGDQVEPLAEKLFGAMFAGGANPMLRVDRVGVELQPWSIVAFNNIIMSYITMAPLYAKLLGTDPMSPESLAKQEELIARLAERVIADYEEQPEVTATETAAGAPLGSAANDAAS